MQCVFCPVPSIFRIHRATMLRYGYNQPYHASRASCSCVASCYASTFGAIYRLKRVLVGRKLGIEVVVALLICGPGRQRFQIGEAYAR